MAQSSIDGSGVAFSKVLTPEGDVLPSVAEVLARGKMPATEIVYRVSRQHNAYLDQGVKDGLLQDDRPEWNESIQASVRWRSPIGKEGEAYLEANKARWEWLKEIAEEFVRRRWRKCLSVYVRRQIYGV